MQNHAHDDALKIYAKMYALYPGSLMAMDRMGWVHRETGNLEMARRFYTEFLEAQPGNPRVLGILDQLNSEPDH